MSCLKIQIVRQFTCSVCALAFVGAMLYSEKEEYDNALSDINEVLRRNSLCSRAYFLKAFLLREMDNIYEAIRSIKEAPEKVQSDEYVARLLKELEEEHALDNKFPQDHPEMLKFNAFMKWLHDGGAVLNKIKVRYHSADYRSVHARVKLKRHELLLQIPKHLIITLEIAKKTPIGAKIKATMPKLLSPKHSLMTVCILQEMHDAESKWKPFIDMLPQSTSNFPIFFTQEELSWLEGSPFLVHVKDKIEDIASDYMEIVEKVPEFSRFSLQEFSHVRMLVSSRVFATHLDGRHTDSLVPLADMFNYGPPQVAWEYREDSKAFFVESVETVARGTELYEAYGRKCNSRYFLNYGFVLENNDRNEVPIKLDLNKDDPLYSTKMKLMDNKPRKLIRVPVELNTQNLDDFFAYLRLIEYEGDPMILYKFAIENSHKAYSHEYDFYETFHMPYIPPVSVKNETAVLNKVLDICGELLGKYPTTYEEDAEMLKGNELTSNQRNCVIMRQGEKKILLNLIDLASLGLEVIKLPPQKAREYYQKKGTKHIYEKYIISLLYSCHKLN
eukprot:TRINITY_DN7776_c0_g1_i5.p1 TRINITY_DN7776_c0_g1~~TRINITY_DN7776_c0_g1_i5.p1  ORF type:complete len:558 (+),score=117.68 TRINITY_DN7776_c0_g1_i5:94-1767(+)